MFLTKRPNCKGEMSGRKMIYERSYLQRIKDICDDFLRKGRRFVLREGGVYDELGKLLFVLKYKGEVPKKILDSQEEV